MALMLRETANLEAGGAQGGSETAMVPYGGTGMQSTTQNSLLPGKSMPGAMEGVIQAAANDARGQEIDEMNMNP